MLLTKLAGKNRPTNYRRNNNFKRRRVPYSLTGSAGRYGPGRNFRIINNDQSGLQGDTTRISLHEVLMNSGEFYALGNSYRYFRVKFIKAVLFPANIVDEPGRIYFNLSWHAIESTDADIKKDDSTKMTSAYRTRTKVLTWYPPDMVIQVNSIAQNPPLNFMNPARINSIVKNNNVNPYPGWLYVMNESTYDIKFDLQFGVEFIGNDFGSVPGKERKMIEPSTMFKTVTRKIEEEKDPDEEEEEDPFIRKKIVMKKK